MQLNKGPEIRWQYFPYCADKAMQDAREKASHKGPKMKLMTSHVNMIKEYLVAWHSIPAAYAKMVLEHPDIKFPCLRTFVYHAQNGDWRTTVGEIECFRPYGSRKIPDKPAEDAKNHSPRLRIDDLPAEVKSGECKKFAQMDTVHSGSKGSGGLLTMVLPTDKHQAFIRKLTDFQQETIHKALRSIRRECKTQGIETDHILTDNGSEFLDEKTIGGIFRAKVYYTHAYAGWEKGAVENLNKLIRRFYPKGTDFSKVTRKQIKALQEKLTAYPRPTQAKKGA